MMISTVRGEFTGITGMVIYDPKDSKHDSVTIFFPFSLNQSGAV